MEDTQTSRLLLKPGQRITKKCMFLSTLQSLVSVQVSRELILHMRGAATINCVLFSFVTIVGVSVKPSLSMSWSVPGDVVGWFCKYKAAIPA